MVQCEFSAVDEAFRGGCPREAPRRPVRVLELRSPRVRALPRLAVETERRLCPPRAHADRVSGGQAAITEGTA